MSLVITNPRILIADEHPIVRCGLKSTLSERFPEATYLECTKGIEAFSKLQSNLLDLAIIEISLTELDGIQILEECFALKIKVPLIVLSSFKEEVYAVRVFQLGAAAYLNKKVDTKTFIQAVEVALQGKRYISSDIAEKISQAMNAKVKATGLDRLSSKEHQIFLRLAKGMPLKEIAADSSISPKTVSTYRTRILAKLHLDSNAEIANYALKNGLVE